MCIKIINGLTFPVWYFATSILLIIGTSYIIHNKYDTDTCYDGVYLNLTLYKIFIVNLIIYLIISFIQIILYILTKCNIINIKLGLLIDMLCLIGMSLLNGIYLNFVLSNKYNCLTNFKISNYDIYIYFILTFTLICIFEILILIKLMSYVC